MNNQTDIQTVIDNIPKQQFIDDVKKMGFRSVVDKINEKEVLGAGDSARFYMTLTVNFAGFNVQYVSEFYSERVKFKEFVDGGE